jgi:hypothetical protein
VADLIYIHLKKKYSKELKKDQKMENIYFGLNFMAALPTEIKLQFLVPWNNCDKIHLLFGLKLIFKKMHKIVENRVYLYPSP